MAGNRYCVGKDCKRKALAGGFCSKHYARFRKHGDPEKTLPRGPGLTSPKERFEDKYLIDPETGCWEWTGALNGNGWAVLSVNGKAILAHRFAYETFIRPILGRNSIGRACGNFRCVNPDHLVLVSKDSVVRFWSHVDKRDDGCWIWKPANFNYKIGKTSRSPRNYAANLAGVSVSSNLYSICGSKKCIRPDHAGTAEDRFWMKVDKDREDGCWIWLGSKLKSGYPHLTFRGKNVYAHRLSYEWAGGILKDDSVLIHTCINKDCVNPDHLDQVSYQEMMERRESSVDSLRRDVLRKERDVKIEETKDRFKEKLAQNSKINRARLGLAKLNSEDQKALRGSIRDARDEEIKALKMECATRIARKDVG